MVKRMEAEIPNKYKLNLSREDRIAYQKILREGRIDLTRQGIYDPGSKEPILSVQLVANKIQMMYIFVTLTD